MSEDPFAELKNRQREMWASFAPTAMFTTPAAGHLVKFAEIDAGEAVLDLGTGTGVVVITAARAGARVTALDLTPDLLAHSPDPAVTPGSALRVEGRVSFCGGLSLLNVPVSAPRLMRINCL